MKNLNSNNFQQFIDKNLVLVDFYANWCPPCQKFMQVAPRVEEAVSDICELGKVDIDAHEELAQEFNIQSIPTFIVFKNGKEITRWSGIKPVVEIENILRTL
jgi:thioredoxin 1